MRFMRLAACAVAFAVVGGMAVAEDMDIKALQAKLAAQEARLNDLQAKMGSGAAEAPASIVSMRKNAKVTIGGDLDFRYIYDNYDVKDEDGDVVGGKDLGDLFVDTADLRVGVEVNEHFDAFMRVGSHDNHKGTGVMRDAWIRWKNIGNSGWGVLIGRDSLKFGMGKPIGMFDAWIQDSGNRGTGIAPHLNYGVARTTQINPYWENCDGSFRFDLSLFQSLESKNESTSVRYAHSDHIADMNYGLGSGTIKLTWKPTEDWTIVAAAANMYANGSNDQFYYARNQNVGFNGPNPFADADAGAILWNDAKNTNNNTALHLGFIWNPAVFCQKLNLWAQATQEFNTNFIKDQDFFGANAGVSYAFTDKFTAFVQGDYTDGDNGDNEITGWRSWVGATYNMGNGVLLEAGWSHEQLKGEDRVTGVNVGKIKGDTLYTRVAFSF